MPNTPNIDDSFDRAMQAFLRGQLTPGGDDCPHPGYLSAYYEGKLASDEALAIEAHVAGCGHCQEQLATLARLDTELAPAPDEAAETPQQPPVVPSSARQPPRAAAADDPTLVTPIAEKPPPAVKSDPPAASTIDSERTTIGPAPRPPLTLLNPEPSEIASEPTLVEPHRQHDLDTGEDTDDIASDPTLVRSPDEEDLDETEIPPAAIAARSSWRWIGPVALAATAVLAISVTYRFAPMMEEASRRALEPRLGSVPQPQAPPRAQGAADAPGAEVAARPADSEREVGERKPEEPPASVPVESAPQGGAAGSGAAEPSGPAAIAEAPLPSAKKEAPRTESEPSSLATSEKGTAGEAAPAPPAERDDRAAAAKDEVAKAKPAAPAPPPRASRDLEDQDKKREARSADHFAAKTDAVPEPASEPSELRSKQSLLGTEATGGAAGAKSKPARAAAAPSAASSASGAIVVARTDPRILWRLTGSGIERSADQGGTWQPQSTHASSDLLAASAPSAEVCWAVGRNGVVVRTTDGHAWQALSPPTTEDLVQVSAWNATSATAKSASGERFSTVDGGLTWSKR